MDRIITALTGVASKHTTALRKRSLRVDVGSAPPTVRALAEALATHDYNIDLGELSMYAVGDDEYVSSLASTIQTSCEEATERGQSFATPRPGAWPGV
jgi:hypothetical protein